MTGPRINISDGTECVACVCENIWSQKQWLQFLVLQEARPRERQSVVAIHYSIIHDTQTRGISIINSSDCAVPLTTSEVTFFPGLAITCSVLVQCQRGVPDCVIVRASNPTGPSYHWSVVNMSQKEFVVVPSSQ